MNYEIGIRITYNAEEHKYIYSAFNEDIDCEGVGYTLEEALDQFKEELDLHYRNEVDY